MNVRRCCVRFVRRESCICALRWLLVFGLYMEAYLYIFKCLSFWLHSDYGKWEGWALKTQVNHTGWMTLVAPAYRPKSVRDSCVIERICSVLVSFHLCIVCCLEVYFLFSFGISLLCSICLYREGYIWEEHTTDRQESCTHQCKTNHNLVDVNEIIVLCLRSSHHSVFITCVSFIFTKMYV